jgi:RNA polymerase sigma-70 factor (ECF subfamily)
MPEPPVTRPSLLVRLRDARDAPAWAQFVQVYAPLVYGFARRQGLQDADAADLTQEVLQTVALAVRRLDYDPARGSFRGWLFTVVRSRLSNFRRHRRTHPDEGSGGTEVQHTLSGVPAPEDDGPWWEAEHERRLFAWAAKQVRPNVEPATWAAFWGTAVEGRAAKEVAGDLGLSVAAVYVAKGRVLARLKEVIREAEGDDRDG